ncbi:hypothetical protein IWX79_003743 [Janthinobacterium sp. CAN_S1]|uniref:hypothetical protein n=1 Tax=Janthinobacterium sp. CAN_S1 TaxID=2787725 RepID=UPI0018C9A3DD
MSQIDFHTGIEFARAVVAHFKLPANTLAGVRMATDTDDVLALEVRIALTADDLAAVARLMNAAGRGNVDVWLSHFLNGGASPGQATGIVSK